jgi:hypothetical protein
MSEEIDENLKNEMLGELRDAEIILVSANQLAEMRAAARTAGRVEALREVEQATFARWASVDDVRRAVQSILRAEADRIEKGGE